MSFARRYTLAAALCASVFIALFVLNGSISAQSKPQKPATPTGNDKKNVRPTPLTPEEQKKLEEEKRLAEEAKNAIFDPNIEKVSTEVVNVDAVVFNKKTGQIITGLKKENFAVFENGTKQVISGFATPESPITVTLLLEYSKWSEIFGSAAGGYFDNGMNEVIRPVAQFLTGFIKPPNDFASVIAFDMRPAVITDFTNDPARINGTIRLLMANRPAFRENNLYDGIKFAMMGGRSESEFLDGKPGMVDYAGITDVKSKRRAVILVASGIDTFSKVNYGEVRKVIQEAGVPIYIISTANLFCKKYCDQLDPSRVMPGTPDRMTFLQAQNAMNTFAAESGGKHFAMTFEGEIPDYLNSINAMLRSQYSLSYDLGERRKPGSKNKLEVKVDVDGDGTYDDKTFVVQHKPFYIAQSDEKKK